MATKPIVASHFRKLLLSFRQILEFRFRENPQGPPVKSDQNKAISVHMLWGSFRHRSTPVLWSRHQKINFLHYISVTAVTNVPLSMSRGTILRRQKNLGRGYRPKIAGILFVRNEPGRSIPYCARLCDRGHVAILLGTWWMADYETLHVCRLHMRDGAIHYKVYLLKLTMAVDNIVFRIIKGAF